MNEPPRRLTILERSYDFQPAGLWSRTILICFAPRSGSNLIARHMWRTGVMGAPQEYFNYDAEMINCAAALGAANLKDYVDKLAAVRTSPNGVFATKLLPGHWEMLRMSRCNHMVSNADIVLTTRRDVVAQAVSMQIAERTGGWTNESPRHGDDELSYDYDAIMGNLRYIEGIYKFWVETLAHRKTPTVIAVYESVYDKPEKVVEMISRTMKIPVNPAAELPHIRIVEKQATSRNLEWAERFRMDMSARGDTLSPSPFAALYRRMDAAQ
jgi:LPS sulfotransferase NodH